VVYSHSDSEIAHQVTGLDYYPAFATFETAEDAQMAFEKLERTTHTSGDKLILEYSFEPFDISPEASLRHDKYTTEGAGEKAGDDFDFVLKQESLQASLAHQESDPWKRDIGEMRTRDSREPQRSRGHAGSSHHGPSNRRDGRSSIGFGLKAKSDYDDVGVGMDKV